MANITYEVVDQPDLVSRRDIYVVKWSLAAGDVGIGNMVGKYTDFCQYADRSLQVTGVWGGATLSLCGDNLGVAAPTNWPLMWDEKGNEISLSDDAFVYVVAPSVFISPVVTGGDVTTALTVTMFFRSNY